VTALVLHALASPYPYTRYLAGTYNKRPIAVIRALAYLPDRIQVRTHTLPPPSTHEILGQYSSKY
jgi:hypothetical protein